MGEQEGLQVGLGEGREVAERGLAGAVERQTGAPGHQVVGLHQELHQGVGAQAGPSGGREQEGGSVPDIIVLLPITELQDVELSSSS